MPESWCLSEPKWLRLNQKISKIYCVIIYNSFFHRIQESNQNQKISNICRSKSQNLIFRFLNAILISMKKCRSESQNSDCSMKKFWRCFIGVSDAAVGWLTTLLLRRSPSTAKDAAVGWESDFSKGERRSGRVEDDDLLKLKFPPSPASLTIDGERCSGRVIDHPSAASLALKSSGVN